MTATAGDAPWGAGNTAAARNLRSSPNARTRIVVVGGGISGLAAAHRIIERCGHDGVDLVLLEAASRLGGVIETERVGEFLFEGGPDSFVTDKPEAADLARRLGLGDELLPTDERFRRTLLVRNGRLHALPEAFQLLAPARILPFLRSPILSWRGKLTALRDLVAPRGGPPPGEDESLASFVRRRLGREVLERIAQPMVGGIYTADPERLSLATTMPRFLELERRHRSVILGLMRQAQVEKAGTSGARFGLFATLRGGLGSLVDALADRLPPQSIRLATRATAITSTHLATREESSPATSGSPWHVDLESGERLAANGVLVALPAPRAADLLRDLDGGLAAGLASIAYASSAVVSVAYERRDVPHALDAFGVVVPDIEGRRIVACSFSSVKYAERSPADSVLIRAFVGGAMHPELFALDDRAIVAAVREELRSLLGIEAEPRLSRLHRWPASMPQYDVGHADRIAGIRSRVARHSGLFLAGNAYAGVGLSDCVRSGEEAADALIGRLGRDTARPGTGAER
jgi:protoporphyrinogen/coproporphyrinogen III oxidase